MTRKILLTQGNHTIVDRADYAWLSQWKWHVDSEMYARRNSSYNGNGKRSAIRMHRFILNAPKEMEVDHINGDRLDNRRCNLRLATKSQNQRNRRSFSGSSKYKGVSWYPPYEKWRASIKLEKWKHLGYFETEEEAAFAYNEAAKNEFGIFSRINIL